MRQSQIKVNRALVADHLSLSNLLNRLDQATSAEWADGMTWYDRAHDIATDLADTYRRPIDTCAAVIAAISPQQAWPVNIELAYELCSDPTVSRDFGLGLGSDRAKLIFSQPDVNPLYILGGPKVRSFYRNIAEPTTAGAVTIDRHAVAILADSVTARWLERYPKFLDRSTVYGQCAAFYRTAARIHNILPQQAQAIAWVSHRNATDNPNHDADF
jgi:hypothetical protein